MTIAVQPVVNMLTYCELLPLMCNLKAAQMNMCNIMAEGFPFMPLGLVRLRTFRLSAWVS